MRSVLLLSLFVILLVSGCSAHILKETNYLGKKHVESIELRNKTIPLPYGTWIVIARGMIGGSTGHFRMVLLKDYDFKIMYEFIIITVDTSSTHASIGYNADKLCTKQGIYHLVVDNNEVGKAQDCWGMMHSNMVFGSVPVLKEAHDFFIENDYKIPRFVIRTHHRFTGKKSKRKYLEYDHVINPEGAGFDPPPITYWGSYEWHPLNINYDPKKVDYIETLKIESAIMHEQLRIGFGD